MADLKRKKFMPNSSVVKLRGGLRAYPDTDHRRVGELDEYIFDPGHDPYDRDSSPNRYLPANKFNKDRDARHNS